MFGIGAGGRVLKGYNVIMVVQMGQGLFKVLCLRFEVAPETKVTLNFGHRTLNSLMGQLT